MARTCRRRQPTSPSSACSRDVWIPRSRSSTSCRGSAATTPRCAPGIRRYRRSLPCCAATTRPRGAASKGTTARASRNREDAMRRCCRQPLALSLLALLQRDSPADRNLYEAFLQLPRTDTSTSIVMAVEYAATLRAGRSRHPGTFDFATRGFHMLLLGLAGCWTGSEPEPQLPPRSSAAFHGYVERLAAGGVLWALAECLTVIADPRADLHPAGGRLHAAAGKQAARLHARLGTRTLAGVVAPLAPWEAPLKSAGAFLVHDAAPGRRGCRARRGRAPAPADLEAAPPPWRPGSCRVRGAGRAQRQVDQGSATIAGVARRARNRRRRPVAAGPCRGGRNRRVMPAAGRRTPWRTRFCSSLPDILAS